MKKLMATLAIYIGLTFATAFVWNLVLFREQYLALAGNLLRAEPIFPLGVGAMFLQGLALYFLFSKFFRSEGSPVQEGLVLISLVAVFDVAYAALVVPAKFNIANITTFVMLEAAFGTIHYALVGIALGWLYKK